MEGAIGKEGKYEVVVRDGKVVLILSLDSSIADAKLEIALEGDVLLDKLAAAIPGKIDDAIIGVIKAAVKAI